MLRFVECFFTGPVERRTRHPYQTQDRQYGDALNVPANESGEDYVYCNAISRRCFGFFIRACAREFSDAATIPA